MTKTNLAAFRSTGVQTPSERRRFWRSPRASSRYSIRLPRDQWRRVKDLSPPMKLLSRLSSSPAYRNSLPIEDCRRSNAANKGEADGMGYAGVFSSCGGCGRSSFCWRAARRWSRGCSAAPARSDGQAAARAIPLAGVRRRGARAQLRTPAPNAVTTALRTRPKARSPIAPSPALISAVAQSPWELAAFSLLEAADPLWRGAMLSAAVDAGFVRRSRLGRLGIRSRGEDVFPQVGVVIDPSTAGGRHNLVGHIAASHRQAYLSP